MNTFPCRDCGKRTPDCHASCPAYLSYKAKREAQLAAYKKERRGYDSAVAQAGGRRAARPEEERSVTRWIILINGIGLDRKG